jgi:hypothetical protein
MVNTGADMAKKRLSPRMGITVPAELRQEMEEVGDGVNWSQVATEAFRAKVLSIKSQTGGTEMDEVIKRMMAADALDTNQDKADGFAAGKEWVTRKDWHATPKQLRRLEAAVMDRDYFSGEPDAFGWAGALYDTINGVSHSDRSEFEEFWEVILGEDEAKRMYDDAFAEGFVDGAMEAWYPIKRKLGG